MYDFVIFIMEGFSGKSAHEGKVSLIMHIVSLEKMRNVLLWKAGEGGTQVYKLYRDVPPKWVVFSQEIF